LYARAASDNAASIRVLTKCGFRVVGEGRGFAHGRNEDIEEVVRRLDAWRDCPRLRQRSRMTPNRYAKRREVVLDEGLQPLQRRVGQLERTGGLDLQGGEGR